MDLLSLVAKLTLDSKSYNEGLEDAETSLGKFGNKMATVSAKTAKASKIAMGGIAAVAGVATKMVKSYADYEQLVGGVETLFGTGGKNMEEYAKSVGKTVDEISGEYNSLMKAQDTVLKNANEAYKTAGLSANEYMETVTSFAASLNASLGGNTELAAKKADMAIRDMSDNANKMGSSMESIQTAYQGFAKQNYTMLDNLKLGYGGTKTEMERLILDAEQLDATFKATRDSNGELTMSYGDIVDAIHVVQTEMGITGTTAEEAEKTVSGSIGMVKAAFQNLMTEFGKSDADVQTAINNLMEAVNTAWDNIEGVLKQIWDNLPLGAKVALAIMGVVAVISPLAGLLANLIVVINGASAAVGVLSGVLAFLAANPIVLVIAAIAALVAGLVYAYQHCEKFRNAVNAAFNHAKEQVIKAIDKIKEAVQFLKDLPGKALNWGKDMIDNFKKGMEERHPILTKAVSGIAGGIKKVLGFSEPEEGPLSNFHTFAPDMIDLFTKGIYQNMGKVEKASDTVASTVSKNIGKSQNNASVFSGLEEIVRGNITVDTTSTGSVNQDQVQMFNALMQMLSQNQMSGSEHTTIIQLDGKTIAKAVDKPLRDIERQRGLSLAGGEAW